MVVQDPSPPDYFPTVTSLWGPEKSLKSSTALTWPWPIWHADFDMGFNRCLQGISQVYRDAAADGTIESHFYPKPLNIHMPGSNQPLQGYKELWYKFLGEFYRAVTSDKYRTIIIDTATQFWYTCHTAYLQEKQEAQLPLGSGTKLREKLISIEYGEPNARAESVILGCKAHGKNLVLTHYETDVYGTRIRDGNVEEYKTGNMTLDGFRRTKNLSDMVLKMSVERNGAELTPHAIITTSGLSLNVEGMDLINPSYAKMIEVLQRMRG